jgi:hypothetical protein
MTVENYLTIYWEAQSAGASAVTLYISLLTGYLIAFYVAGEKFSTRQSIFLTMLFVVLSAIPVWGVFEYFSAAMKAARAIEKDFLLIGLLDINPATFLVPLMVAGIVGCLNFAWESRKPK